MTYNSNNRGFSDSFTFQLKDFLSSHPKLKNNSRRIFAANNSLSSLIAEFQQHKKLKIINGQLNNETFRALGEDMSPMQMQMATMFNPELRYLFVGETLDGFINKSRWNGLPVFERLWKIHRGNGSTYIDPKTGKYPGYPKNKIWEHQCAINMSYALQATGVNMSSYTGRTLRTYVVSNDVAVIDKYWVLARDVYQLAEWVRAWYDNLSSNAKESPKNKHFKESEKWIPYDIYEDTSLLNWLKSFRDEWGYRAKGIVILYDHWQDKGVNRGHIDLWNGDELKRGDESEITHSKYIRFLPLK